MASSSASASSSQSTVLPTITIQHTFTEVLNDVHSGKVPSEKFWVSIYKQGQESVHARILAELDEADRDLVVLQSPDVSFEGRGREFSVSCEKMGLAKTRVLVPIQTYVDSDRADRHEVRYFHLPTSTSHRILNHLLTTAHNSTRHRTNAHALRHRRSRRRLIHLPHPPTKSCIQSLPRSRLLLHRVRTLRTKHIAPQHSHIPRLLSFVQSPPHDVRRLLS